MTPAQEQRWIHEGDRVDELSPGTTLLHGQYTIECYLNSGGFGITYLARDSLERQVVIKECFPGALCTRQNATVCVRSRTHLDEFGSIVRRFIQEARRLAKLQHPNIVGVHQVFEDNETAYMALDYVDGSDLLELVESPWEKPSPAEIQAITLKLLEAVKFIHSQGILHRDISPDNVLVTNRVNPVLIDFGSSHEDPKTTARVLSELRVVKDGYSPYEFYVAGSRQAPCSDLYALGATLYHVITGSAPVDSQSRLAAKAARKPDPFSPLLPTLQGYTPAFLEAINTALAVLPEDRIQSASQWAKLLEAASVPAAEVAPAPRPDPTPPAEETLPSTPPEAVEVPQPASNTGTPVPLAEAAPPAPAVQPVVPKRRRRSKPPVVDSSAPPADVETDLQTYVGVTPAGAEVAHGSDAPGKAAAMSRPTRPARPKPTRSEPAPATAERDLSALRPKGAKQGAIAPMALLGGTAAALAVAAVYFFDPLGAPDGGNTPATPTLASGTGENPATPATETATRTTTAALLPAVPDAFASATEAAPASVPDQAPASDGLSGVAPMGTTPSDPAPETTPAPEVAHGPAPVLSAAPDRTVLTAEQGPGPLGPRALAALPQTAQPPLRLPTPAELSGTFAAPRNPLSAIGPVRARVDAPKMSGPRLSGSPASAGALQRAQDQFSAPTWIATLGYAPDITDARPGPLSGPARTRVFTQVPLATLPDPDGTIGALPRRNSTHPTPSADRIGTPPTSHGTPPAADTLQTAALPAPRVPETPSVMDMSAVMSGWTLGLTFTESALNPTVVAATFPEAPEWMGPGTEILRANGVQISALSEIPKIVAMSSAVAGKTTIGVELEYRVSGQTGTAIGSAELPVVREVALLNGLRLQAGYRDGSWETVVIMSPTESQDALRPGDRLIAYIPTNEPISGATTFADIVERELANGTTQFPFAVKRNADLWVATLRYSVFVP